MTKVKLATKQTIKTDAMRFCQQWEAAYGFLPVIIGIEIYKLFDNAVSVTEVECVDDRGCPCRVTLRDAFLETARVDWDEVSLLRQ